MSYPISWGSQLLFNFARKKRTARIYFIDWCNLHGCTNIYLTCQTCSSLGLCKRCGDLRMIACSRCRGTGLIKANGPFSFNLIDNLYQSEEIKVKSVGCTKCQARGHFSCPDCSNASTSWFSIMPWKTFLLLCSCFKIWSLAVFLKPLYLELFWS